MHRLLRLPLLAFTLVLACAAASASAQDVWLPRTSGVTQNLWGVAYGNNTWVAVGDPGVILTSPDGLTWTRQPIPATLANRWLVSVTYANGLFVVTGGTPPASESLGVLLTSPDGVTWTTRINGSTRINNATYGNGTWLAVDDLGGRWTSLDGLTWSFGFTTRTGYLRGLAYGAPAFVTTGLSSIQSSYDGISWSNRIPGAGQIEGLAYGRGRFIAMGTLGLAGITYASRDGLTWTQQPTTTDLSARSIVFFNNQFIVTGTANTDGGGLATSFDGTAWTPRATGISAGAILLASAAGPTSAVVVGTGGLILQSPASLTAPSVATQPTPALEAIGGHVAFTVTARGSLPLSYQWRKDGLTLDGATADTLFLPAVSEAASGNYSCVITNAAGTAISADAALTVVTTFPAADPVDTTFTLGPSLDVAPNVTAAQPDGKILLGGSFLLLNQGQPQYGLARLNADGSLDTTFKPGSLNPLSTVTSLAVQPDGRILVSGTFSSINGTPRSGFVRLTTTGAIDSEFNPPASIGSGFRKLSVASDGRIYAMLFLGNLLRLRSDGAVDPTWIYRAQTVVDSAGRNIVAATSTFDLQSDGKVIVCISAPGVRSDILMRRANQDGSLDDTFPNISLPPQINALRVLADGRIMVAATGIGTFIQRFSSNGVFDATFPLTISSPPTAAAFTPDGRTWLSGTFTSINGISRRNLARLNIDGSIDATYNPGLGLQRAGGLQTDASSLLALDDGRAIITGAFTTINNVPRTQVARLNSVSLGGANLPAIVNFSPLYRELRAGEPLTLSVDAAGSAQISYSYTMASTGITLGSGFTGGLIPIPAGALTASVPLSIFATNAVGTSAPQTFFVRIVPSAPFVTQNPAPLQTNVGRPITLSATFGGSAGTTYQWFKNGTALAGSSAASNVLSIPRALATDTGDYTLVARNSLGFASSLTVHVGVDELARFVNLATRGNVGRSDAPLIVGFVAAGPGNKRVMLRAVGPTLGSFGVPGTLADPVMQVYNAAGALIYTNDDWGQSNDVPGIGTANTRLGAFQLEGGSADAAGILTLSPGAYTAVITGKTVNNVETTGVALAEIYEDDSSSSRLTNLSSRGFVSPGASVMIPAFVTGTTTTPTTKKLLVRGVGPALTAFGVAGALANPTLSIVDNTGRTVATNDDWETNSNLPELRAATALLAFPLAAGSRDAALLVTLAPGAYTCVVSGVNNTSGTALVEVYEVP